MTLAAIGRIVAQILIAVTGNSDLTNRILSTLGLPAQQFELDVVKGLVQEDHDLLRDSTVGLDAIQTIVETINTNLIAGVTAIEAAIALVQQSGDPVTLPDPPPGYGGGGGDTPSVDDIWGYILTSPVSGSMGWYLGGMYTHARTLQEDGAFLSTAGPYFTIINPPLTDDHSDPSDVPVISASTILADDTVLSWLTREDEVHEWGASFIGLDFPVAASTAVPTSGFMCVIDPAWFAALKASTSTTLMLGAPLWPGSDLVTMGDPVDLAATVDLAGPMDGVLVTLATTPPDKPHYTLGDVTATAHIGQVSFQSVEGHMEYPQQLSFADHVYVPHSMTVAGACKVRCVPGVTGTITPWSLI